MNTVWTYWEGDKSPFMQLCLDTMERHNADFRIADPDFVRSMDGGEEAWDLVADLPVPQRSDYLRLFILHRFGGIWTDSDCIQVDRFDWDLGGVDLIGVHNVFQRSGFGVDGILATPWGCRPESPAIALAMDLCRRYFDKMKAGERVPYGQTSVGLLSRLWKEQRNRFIIQRRQHWRFNRVPWQRCREDFNRVRTREGHEASNQWSPNAVSYHLTNVIPKPNATKTREQVLREGRRTAPLYSFLFQKAFGLHPAIYGRSREILSRLPEGPRTGVEVGVFRGQNARHLLQQRRDLQLTLVDPWGVSEHVDRYKRTGDYQAKFGQAKWDGVFEFVGRTLAFANGRFERLRMGSTSALSRVPDKSQDFVFIDGDHSYGGVKADLAWASKVKPGGFIGGHDYNHKREGTRYGVKRAVDEWASQHGLTIETGIDWTWFARL